VPGLGVGPEFRERERLTSLGSSVWPGIRGRCAPWGAVHRVEATTVLTRHVHPAPNHPQTRARSSASIRRPGTASCSRTKTCPECDSASMTRLELSGSIIGAPRPTPFHTSMALKCGRRSISFVRTWHGMANAIRRPIRGACRSRRVAGLLTPPVPGAPHRACAFFVLLGPDCAAPSCRLSWIPLDPVVAPVCLGVSTLACSQAPRHAGPQGVPVSWQISDPRRNF
jgi:hypothetical protein